MFYVAELQNGASSRKPTATNAKTLRGAKIAAGHEQTFVGTTLAVYDSEGYKLAQRDSDGWFDLDGDRLNCAPDFFPEVQQ